MIRTVKLYSSKSLNAFCADLGIHHTSYKKHIVNKELFLGYFIISNSLISEAVPTDLTEEIIYIVKNLTKIVISLSFI